jgi:hypothetical protein
VVLVLAADAGVQCDVLRGLAHRDVDVGDVAVVAGVVPLGGALGLRGGAGLRLIEQRVLAVGSTVGRAEAEARHRLDAGGDEHVALAGLDGVECHPRGLQRRRAVAVDRGAGQEVVAEFDGHRASDVVARLTSGLCATHHQVVDVLGGQRRHLVQYGAHDLGGQVVRPHGGQRPLYRPSDWRPSGGDDDGFRHGNSSSNVD